MSNAIVPIRPLPLLGKLSARQRRAYEKCSLDPHAVTAQPAITPQLRKIAFDTAKLIPYGPEENPVLGVPILDTIQEHFSPKDPLYYLHASSDPAAQEILAKYYGTDRRYRNLLPLEAYCLMAAVPTTRCFEIIVATCVRVGAQASVLLAAVTQPYIVKKTIDMALTDEGSADRALMHKHSGFLPSPRGPQIHVPVTVNARAEANAAAVAAPPPERTISRMVDRFNDAHLSGGAVEPQPTSEVIDATIESLEDDEEPPEES